MGRAWVRSGGWLAFTGATLGTALDAIHTHTGTTVYSRPVLLRAAWWVPLLFAAAAVAMGLSRPLADRLAGRAARTPGTAAVVGGMTLFMLAYVLSGVLPLAWPARSLVLAAVFGLAWTAYDRTRVGLGLAVATAIVGTLVEMALVASGAFAYLAPAVGGVAGWLPWLYMTGAVGVGGLGEWLLDAPAVRAAR